MLHPFAPHLGEELWSKLGHTESIYRAPWPEFDAFMTIDDEVTIAIQVNGKLRATKEFLNGVAAEEVISEAYSLPDIAKWTAGKKVIREIFIPNKLLNIVVGE
jgi:leucyl-tRNA synthetase